MEESKGGIWGTSVILSTNKIIFKEEKKRNVGECQVDTTIKSQHEGDLCGNGIVLYLDRSAGYINLHIC